MAADNQITGTKYVGNFGTSVGDGYASKEKDGDMWEVERPFAFPIISDLGGHEGDEHFHTGDDWSRENSSETHGQLVGSIANGRVFAIGDEGNVGFGKWVVVEHFFLSADGASQASVSKLAERLEQPARTS